MGEVYRARDTRLGREVAIKVLPADVASDPDRARRFEQEARAASALNHPNILTIHDFGTENGVTYLVTELLRGETLRDVITRGRLSTGRVAGIASQVSRGLAAAHHAGIVHRDLKPENLFITQDGTCKVLDFGLARMNQPLLTTSTNSKTPTAAGTVPGILMGTAGYMAPEQVRGEQADARSDLFALGVVIQEMLTSRNPFGRDTVIESLNAILKEEPPTIVPATPLAPIVRRCLEKEPARRFQSASDLAFALESNSGGAASVSRRMPMAAVIAAAVVVVTIGAFALLRSSGDHPASGGATPVRSLAVIPFTSLSHDPSDEYFSAGMTDALTTELSRIAALKVIANRSAAQLVDAKRAPSDVAKELGVEALVTGSVLRNGNRVRISARLSEAASDRILWAENYERPVSDVLALQSEVTRAIADAIELELSPAEKTRLSAAVTVDPRALDEYLRGRYLWSKRTEESVRASLGHFQESARIAADFALAYNGIADAYLILAAYNYEQPRQVTPLALEALNRAMALDSTAGEPHATRGDFALHVERNYVLSIRELDRAVALSPGYAFAHNWRSEVLFVLRRFDEAIAEARTGIELDPLTPYPRYFIAFAHEAKGDYTQAEKYYREAIEVEPGFVLSELYVEFLLRSGRNDEALTVAKRLADASPIVPNIVVLGMANALSGYRQEAEKCLATAREMAAERWQSPYDFAVLEAALGRHEDAIRHFREAMEVPDFRMPFKGVLNSPAFDVLKDDPEFQQMVKSLRPR